MATSSINPEKFETGDIVSWLRQFECCATANSWNDEKKLQVLPAFLRGPAATYFYALSDEAKDTYAHLKANLQKALCPEVDREKYFAEFEHRHLRPEEDPALFLWSLQESLTKADPSLGDSAREVLLARQFMRGLPEGLRLKLLESNPTPSLKEMINFVKRFRAVHRPEDKTTVFAAKANHDAIKNIGSDGSNHLQQSLTQLTAAVTALTDRQTKLEAALSASQAQPPPQESSPRNGPKAVTSRDRFQPRPPSDNNRKQRRCFNCNGLGHFANSCPYDLQCEVCFGWGHTQHQCANNFTRQPQSTVTGKSLNFKGVPR